MTQLLISITSIEEAKIALENGADIIDLKDPSKGALGALPLALIQGVVSFVSAQPTDSKRLTSATVGDLPMQPELILEHVIAMANTGVDIIKIGFFEADDYQPCLDTLKSVTRAGIKLIAVLFAEYTYPKHLITTINEADFYGVMMDTAHKNGKTFLDYISIAEIKNLTAHVQELGLVFGLAGSLTIKSCAMVRQLNLNYIGFRGGVCVSGQRKLALNADKILAVRNAL